MACFARLPDAVKAQTRKAYRLLFSDAGFVVRRLGYESVMPGTSIVSGWTREKRRPWPLRAAVWLPLVRRNVWLLAESGK